MCLPSVVAIAQHNRHTGKLIALSRERQWNEYKEWKRRWFEWEGGVAYKNRACQQTEVPYERYILMPACLRVCVSASRLIYGPSCWSVLCIFPQERERERREETGSEGDSVSEDIVRHFATLFTLCINECHLLILCHIMSAPDGRL